MNVDPNTRAALSLKKECARCEDSCCRGRGSPIVAEDEYLSIVEIYRGSAAFFSEKVTGTDLRYFVIDRVKDKNGGGNTREREPGDPCPFLDEEENLCLIQDCKPVDCVIYPIKPFYRSADALRAEWVRHKSCPANCKLTEDFINPACTLGKQFLHELGKARLAHYVDTMNRWPIEQADANIRAELGDDSTLDEEPESYDCVELVVCLCLGEQFLGLSDLLRKEDIEVQERDICEAAEQIAGDDCIACASDGKVLRLLTSDVLQNDLRDWLGHADAKGLPQTVQNAIASYSSKSSNGFGLLKHLFGLNKTSEPSAHLLVSQWRINLFWNFLNRSFDRRVTAERESLGSCWLPFPST